VKANIQGGIWIQTNKGKGTNALQVVVFPPPDGRLAAITLEIGGSGWDRRYLSGSRWGHTCKLSIGALCYLGNKWTHLLTSGSATSSTIPTGYTVCMYSKGISYTGIRMWNGRIYLINDHVSAFGALICHVSLDILALTMILHKLLRHARFIKNPNGEGEQADILTVMAHDSIAYFFLSRRAHVSSLPVCTLTNMIGVKHFPADLHGFLLVTCCALDSTFTSRSSTTGGRRSQRASGPTPITCRWG